MTWSRSPVSPIWLSPLNWSRLTEYPSGMITRWNTTARRVWPKVSTFLVSPSNFRAGGYQQMLPVVRIDVGGEQALDGTGKSPVEAVDENGFENGSFK